MKRALFGIILFLQTHLVSANCESPIKISQQNYCWEISWQNGEKKNKNKFEPIKEKSPHLIPMREKPQNWVYSKAKIKFWELNDISKESSEIPNLQVFPYMHMKNGHHHSTEYNFSFDKKTKNYWLEQMTLHEMHGCWSLRWSTNKDEDESTSELLLKLLQFENLNEAANKKVLEGCR